MTMIIFFSALQLLFWLQLKRRAREFTILLLSFFFISLSILSSFLVRSSTLPLPIAAAEICARRKCHMQHWTYFLLAWRRSFRCGCCCRLKWLWRMKNWRCSLRAQQRGRSETKLNILRCRLLSIYAIELESNSFRRSTVAATMMRIVMQRSVCGDFRAGKIEFECGRSSFSHIYAALFFISDAHRWFEK